MISLNAKELAQLLNDRGWYVVRQRGSHARWYNQRAECLFDRAESWHEADSKRNAPFHPADDRR